MLSIAAGPRFRSGSRWSGNALGVALVVAVLGILLAGSAQAAVFTVTSRGDDRDANPGDGKCEATPGIGDCTLRGAIEEANALPGADRIILPALVSPGAYVLTDVTALAITDSLTIIGGGASTTSIDGAMRGGGAPGPVLASSAPTVHISGVTIRNGSRGGGLAVTNGAMTLTNSTVSGNSADRDGGGIS